MNGGELRRMQALAQVVWREAPRTVDVTMAELAYAVGIGASDGARIRIWPEAGAAGAWAWFTPPGSFAWTVDPRTPELLHEVLDWAEAQAEAGPPLKTVVRDGDARAHDVLRTRGFEPEERPWLRLNHRTLERIDEPELPDGYVVKTVADYDGEIAKRVVVHRRSWADLGTRVALDTYPGVMTTWPYRSDLDFVLESDDGTPVSFALGWLDQENAVGEFEPVGTDPAYRGRGLGRALLLAALRRFQEAGAREAIVGSRGDAGHPIPSKLYESAGFVELSRQLPLTRASG